MSLYPGRAANKFGLLTGSIVSVDSTNLAVLGTVTVVVLAVLAVVYRPLLFASTDPDVAVPQDYYGGQDTLGALAATAVDAPVVYQATESSVVAAQFFVGLSDLAASGDDPETVYRSLVDANSGR